MKRIKDDFLDLLEAHVPLTGLNVVDMGCGNGARSATIAARCQGLIGIDANEELIQVAKSRAIPNASFVTRLAHNISQPNASADVVIFTLLLHHLPQVFMVKSITEAVRVVKPAGHIVFLEPTSEGSFFEAEVRFSACDGDETGKKELAQQVIRDHELLLRPAVAEFDDETVFTFESVEDFVTTMMPQRGLARLKPFLCENKYALVAMRHTQIYRPRK